MRILAEMKCFIGVVLIIVTCSSVNLFAGSFQDSLDKNKSASALVSGDDITVTADSSSSSNANSPFLDFLFTVLGELWILDVKPVVYGGYPYADGGFVSFLPVVDSWGDLGWTPGRHWWCTTGGSAGLIYRGLNQLYPSGELTLESQFFKLLGPDLNVTVFNDEGDPLMLSQAAVRVNILQFNPFVWSWYIGYGNKSEYSPYTKKRYTDHGVTLGTDVRIFPVQPLTLHGRWGVVILDSHSITDVKLELGWMIDTVELFMEKRSLSTGNPNDSTSYYHQIDSISVGTRWWL